MRLILDTGVTQDLTSAQIIAVNTKLRNNIPNLVSWSYSPLTGELTLDWGDVDEDALRTKLRNARDKLKTDYPKVRALYLIILEMIKKWEE